MKSTPPTHSTELSKNPRVKNYQIALYNLLKMAITHAKQLAAPKN